MHTDAQEHTHNHKHTLLRKLIIIWKDIQLIIIGKMQKKELTFYTDGIKKNVIVCQH